MHAAAATNSLLTEPFTCDLNSGYLREIETYCGKLKKLLRDVNFVQYCRHGDARKTQKTLDVSLFHPLSWHPLLPYGYSYCWHLGTLTLIAERQSAQMSTITNDGLTRSGTGCLLLWFAVDRDWRCDEVGTSQQSSVEPRQDKRNNICWQEAEAQCIWAASSAGYHSGHVVDSTVSYTDYRAVGVWSRAWRHQ